MECAYYCQLQVSNKFRRTMDPFEAVLIDWMEESFVHRTVMSVEEQGRVVDLIEERVHRMNAEHAGNGPYLLVIWAPLRSDESGYIRIERTSGRHQSVLLPIIDYRGEVKIED